MSTEGNNADLQPIEIGGLQVHFLHSSHGAGLHIGAPRLQLRGRSVRFRLVTPAHSTRPKYDDGLRWSDDYGYMLRDAYGGVVFSTRNTTWSQVATYLVPGGASDTRTLRAIRNRDALAVRVAIDPPPTDRLQKLHEVTFGTLWGGGLSGKVTVSGGKEDTLVMVLMR